jgi:hypothetical protein
MRPQYSSFISYFFKIHVTICHPPTFIHAKQSTVLKFLLKISVISNFQDTLYTNCRTDSPSTHEPNIAIQFQNLQYVSFPYIDRQCFKPTPNKGTLSKFCTFQSFGSWTGGGRINDLKFMAASVGNLKLGRSCFVTNKAVVC